jgi:hypothetical protein
MMLLQHAAAAGAHPLTGTVARYMWLLPLLPLLGFVINGLLSLTSAIHFGADDPSASHDDVPGTHGTQVHAHDESGGGGHGDDHHPVARHKHAPLTSLVGPGVLLLSFLLATFIFMAMRAAGAHEPFIQRYFSWMPVGDLQIDVAFQLDQLSMLMVMIITGIGTLIHIFSVGYMADDPGYPRFFAYLNLFVFFMLVLVLGSSYPLMFVGWEGVGLCSYLLIGFWFSEKANADAGKKAFIVNRIGDFGFLIAMFMLFANTGALDYVGVNAAVAPPSACSSSSAAPARARRFHCMSGCRTPWRARRRSPRSSMRLRWSPRACTSSRGATSSSRWRPSPASWLCSSGR